MYRIIKHFSTLLAHKKLSDKAIKMLAPSLKNEI
jgi:hypothetical protein